MRGEGEEEVDEQLRPSRGFCFPPALLSPLPQFGPCLRVTTPGPPNPRASLWLLPLQAVLVQRAGREAAFRPRLGHGSRLPVPEGTELLTVTSGWWCPNSVRDSALHLAPHPTPRRAFVFSPEQRPLTPEFSGPPRLSPAPCVLGSHGARAERVPGGRRC